MEWWSCLAPKTDWLQIICRTGGFPWASKHRRHWVKPWRFLKISTVCPLLLHLKKLFILALLSDVPLQVSFSFLERLFFSLFGIYIYNCLISFDISAKLLLPNSTCVTLLLKTGLWLCIYAEVRLFIWQLPCQMWGQVITITITTLMPEKRNEEKRWMYQEFVGEAKIMWEEFLTISDTSSCYWYLLVMSFSFLALWGFWFCFFIWWGGGAGGGFGEESSLRFSWICFWFLKICLDFILSFDLHRSGYDESLKTNGASAFQNELTSFIIWDEWCVLQFGPFC